MDRQPLDEPPLRSVSTDLHAEVELRRSELTANNARIAMNALLAKSRSSRAVGTDPHTRPSHTD